MKTVWVLLLVFIWTGCNSGSEQTENNTDESMEMAENGHDMSQMDSGEEEEEVLSPPREASGTIGNTRVLVDYSAPSVRDRVIWGELVPYGEIWVSGAHMATSIEFDYDVLINGEPVPAGKYAFYTIPGEENWTVILNENWDQHQANDYDQDLDVARFEVTPGSGDFTEQLSYSVISETDNSGVIELVWEEVMIRVPVNETGE